MLWQPALPDRYLRLSDQELADGIRARKAQLGDQLLVLGHHYQQDDVVQHADLTGDSLKLSQMAAEEAARRGSRFIVFCGVHFMAETADILTDDSVRVILPDLSAGCSMADMAQYDEAVEAWETIQRAIAPRTRVVPITYVNSSAAIKAFVGSKGGACCTSSNAQQVFEWAMRGGDEPLAKGEQVKILFLPDQHLGRNTAKRKGFVTELDATPAKPAQTALWDPRLPSGGLEDAAIRDAKVLLWAGHCSVHKLFRPEHVAQVRAQNAKEGGITVLVHPECAQEVVDIADLAGSTEYIIRTVEEAPAGSRWAVATEVHLVNRIAARAAGRGVFVRMLSDCQCLCTTMYRIDPQHLLWTLDNLAEGKVVNEIRVHPQARQLARLALERMLRNAAPAPAAKGQRAPERGAPLVD
ncbi:MAG: quinolinate synthase NadA [Phycisphaerales bacterium]